MLYTNLSLITKTFHGVELRPGETKEIPGIVNDPKVVISSKRQEPPKRKRRTRTRVESVASGSKTTATVVDEHLIESSLDIHEKL